MTQPLTLTDFKDLKLFRRGKVRDVYDLGDTLLIIATDRISAFDVVMPNPIPNKGKVLTQISIFWFEHLKDIVPTHFITDNVKKYPKECQPHAAQLAGRSMLVKKTNALQVECVVRGYLSGSGLKEYQQSGTVCGIKLPVGLVEASKLPEPIFTPSTKAEVGHDENISFDEVVKTVGKDLAEKVRHASIAIYKKALGIAEKVGIIIADTKFEFGILDGKLILIDEVLTPDSSRFWPAREYQPGKAQPSFDKQYLRDWLISTGWNKKPPAPELPPDVIKNTGKKYLEAIEKLTGKKLK